MDLNKERYFQHFKGGLYKLLVIAKDSETMEQVIVYQAMYGKFEVWVRSKEQFFSTVKYEGRDIPRFRELTNEEFQCLHQKIKHI